MKVKPLLKRNAADPDMEDVDKSSLNREEMIEDVKEQVKIADLEVDKIVTGSVNNLESASKQIVKDQIGRIISDCQPINNIPDQIKAKA